MEEQFVDFTENTKFKIPKWRLQSISLPCELSDKLICSHNMRGNLKTSHKVLDS